MQRNGGLMRGVFQSAGGSGLRAARRALGGDGGFKVGDVDDFSVRVGNGGE